MTTANELLIKEPYACQLADPPWNESGGGRIKRGADRHYGLLKTPQIIEVYLEDGLMVMRSLGFRYVTNAVWAKQRIGLGRYLRGQHELLLFGVRGRLPALGRSSSTLIGKGLLPRDVHSRKPTAAHELIESVSPGPRVEFFARARRDGWDAMGDEL